MTTVGQFQQDYISLIYRVNDEAVILYDSLSIGMPSLSWHGAMGNNAREKLYKPTTRRGWRC